MSNLFTKYRIVFYNMIGNRTASLQKRNYLFLWKDVVKSDPGISPYQFLQDCQEFLGKRLKIVDKSMPV
jgi:hypothetical protein